MNKTYKIIDAHNHIYPAKIAEKASEAVGKCGRLQQHPCRLRQ